MAGDGEAEPEIDSTDPVGLSLRSPMQPAGASTNLPDAYERQYMTKGGRVRARHRMVSGWKFNSLMGGTAAYVAASAVMAGTVSGAALPLAVIGALWLALSVLRVTVTDHAVNIQYATFGPSIPLHAITSVRAIRYNALRHGGWGFRRRNGGRLYNMPGDEGQGVEIRWRDAKGKDAVVTVGIKTAPEVVESVLAAIDALGVSPETTAVGDGGRKALGEGAQS